MRIFSDVDGYEYPNPTSPYDDWLVVEAGMRDGGRHWVFAEPWLMAGDPELLARWLEDDGSASNPGWATFTPVESLVWFDRSERGDGRLRISVTFGVEGKPAWLSIFARVEPARQP